LWVRRRHVFSFAQEADDDPVPLFTASMIWGYGDRGYGATRTAKILWSTKWQRFRANLAGVIAAAHEGPEAAWDALRSTHRTYLFGPAFGTKFAYFATGAEPSGVAVRPLSADRNTATASWSLCGLSRSAERRSSYLRYVEMAHRWADGQVWRADEVEWALFSIGKDILAGRLDPP
jgi:hypothetical protein